jgi:hypothetical protein
VQIFCLSATLLGRGIEAVPRFFASLNEAAQEFVKSAAEIPGEEILEMAKATEELGPGTKEAAGKAAVKLGAAVERAAGGAADAATAKAAELLTGRTLLRVGGAVAKVDDVLGPLAILIPTEMGCDDPNCHKPKEAKQPPVPERPPQSTVESRP